MAEPGKYVGKQVVGVEAMKLKFENPPGVIGFMKWTGARAVGTGPGFKLYVQRQEDGGWNEVLPGEWVLRFPDGHLEVWGDIAFREVFEEVDT